MPLFIWFTILMVGLTSLTALANTKLPTGVYYDKQKLEKLARVDWKKAIKEKKASIYMQDFVALVRPVGHQQLKSMVLNGSRRVNPKVNSLFRKYPKSLDFFIGVLKHPTAVIDLIKILEARNKLIIFLILTILSFFLGIYIKVKTKHIHNIFARSFLWFSRFTMVMGLRIGFILMLFGENLRSTWAIFRQTVLS